MARRGYDRGSGQVYMDRVVPSFVYSSDATGPSWSHESPFLPTGWEECSPCGANSLKHMAMRKALLDQRPLTALHFSNIPWELAKYLWDCLGLYPLEFREIAPYYSLNASTKKMSLRNYSRLIHSPSLSWGTILSISTDHADLHDLVEISKITNLVALDITTSSPVKSISLRDDDVPITKLTDRVVRSWSELAGSSEAFNNLRVLMLHLQTDVTLRIFSYLDRFPSLEALVVVGCPHFADDSAKTVGHQHGWGTRIINATDETIYECYTNYITSIDSTANSKVPDMRSLPLLDFSLGAPGMTAYKKKPKSVWFHRQIKNSNVGLPNKKRVAEHEIIGPASNSVKKQGRKTLPKIQKSMNTMAGLLAEFEKFDTPPFASPYKKP
ncbi:hypothetical protein GX51_08078 [Blastomyces parvus]|uniref:Uncharacterized protein n=1 Tax=Blastomyces parvus TaxID=2060905 RepID=A0A2B7WH43_9EURO|nr:hypothetical protein GX51_08078 [Blastomyces parvus]